MEIGAVHPEAGSVTPLQTRAQETASFAPLWREGGNVVKPTRFTPYQDTLAGLGPSVLYRPVGEYRVEILSLVLDSLMSFSTGRGTLDEDRESNLTLDYSISLTFQG